MKFASLKTIAKLFYIIGVLVLVAGMLLSFVVKPVTAQPANQDLKLNLSHIACVNGQVEIHFVLLNVPEGVTPGILTYTYGTIQPTKDSGNVWHYFDYKPSGSYDVKSASVVVNGVTVTLSNPGNYAGNYDCSPTTVPTSTTPPTATPRATTTQLSTPTSTATVTLPPTATFTATPTMIITEPPTFTPTATFTATPTIVTETSTPTVVVTEPTTPVPTEVPTDTSTPAPTQTPASSLLFSFVCSVEGTAWKVSNPNSFDVTFSFSVNGGAFTDFTVPAGASGLTFATSAPTTGSLRVLYTLNGDPFDISVVKDTACTVSTTSTPASTVSESTAQSTPVPTLSVPGVSSTGVLIPVTGADLSSTMRGNFGQLQKTLIDSGFGFLGIGLVLQGISKKKEH